MRFYTLIATVEILIRRSFSRSEHVYCEIVSTACETITNVARQSGISVSRNPRAVTTSDAQPQTICENSTILLRFSGDCFSYAPAPMIAAILTCSLIDGVVNTSMHTYKMMDYDLDDPFDITVHLSVAFAMNILWAI